VGDSGEKDPEIYGRLARQHPRQITAICIRQLTARPISNERLQKTFRDLPEQSIRLFECPSELPNDLNRLVLPEQVAMQA
jgi:phosphatidate phosphatase APP1